MTTTTTTATAVEGSLVGLLGHHVLGIARNGQYITGQVIAISQTRESVCVDGATLSEDGAHFGTDRLWVDRDGLRSVGTLPVNRGTAGGVR